MTAAKSLFVHLRLHFQLLLAPVYLWGWLIAGGGLGMGVILGFAAFHFFLYSGATAFNSYYDRDVGPVGGLEHPPEVVAALLPFSLAVQGLGWIIAAFVNASFAVAYGAFVALSVAYSHPGVRLKARPLASLVVVGFGQGALAFVAAWAATRGEVGSLASIEGVLGAVAATLLILALYPLSQLYQTAEDAARGDRTVAVVWGARRCFAFAVLCMVLGGLAMLALLARRFGALDGLVVGLGLLIELGALVRWASRFNPGNLLGNYHAVMRLNAANAVTLSGYLLLRLAFAR
jgi:4-hydroxybenzoate polyprenyltransferase